MSPEIWVALIGLAGVAVTAAVKVWEARRRSDTDSPTTLPPPSPNAQALREEAVEALTDVLLTVGEVHPMGVDHLSPVGHEVVTSTLEAMMAQDRRLVLLRSRLRVAGGVSEAEVEAFGDAVEMAIAVSQSVSVFADKLRDYANGTVDSEVLEAERSRIGSAVEKSRIALLRFEELARQGAAN